MLQAPLRKFRGVGGWLEASGDGSEASEDGSDTSAERSEASDDDSVRLRMVRCVWGGPEWVR